MQFLQPILLWGLLGISIPILIHLWQGKKGQVIHWAAMHWLTTQESSVAKGLRLENVLVLLLRILLLVLLVLLLSQVYISKLSKVAEERIIHLVQPNRQTIQEYKFELQQAFEKGEEVYWADENLTSIESLDDLKSDGKPSDIQASLDKSPSNTTMLNLYLSNSQNALKTEFYLSPLKPNFFLESADFAKSQNQLISIEGGKELVVNERGLLDSISDGTEAVVSVDLNRDHFAYFLGEISDSESVFIKASLEAITDVYGFNFVEKEQIEEAKLIFDKQLPAKNGTDKLYFISDHFSFSEQSNLVSFSEQLDFEHSDLVQTGKLPEVILERFLAFSGVEKLDVRISQSQLERRFLVENHNGQNKKANLNLLLLGLFALCLAVERYLANRQGI
ncbi:BatA domain-containing protein [Algoriphagus antarcticus]|uniref:Putative membrane protein (TIGR02226 family) n=1 Tax=Algoriphagus antarcticus TaxID=238540 RepID=A0A3E0DYL5_9BACT|nr:BatA domain-containing protein [Algoriphagus antarcticus]REG88226.1 putative membrane protein (TIGR02226 family) [Algoriphagus antarcticus]